MRNALNLICSMNKRVLLTMVNGVTVIVGGAESVEMRDI